MVSNDGEVISDKFPQIDASNGEYINEKMYSYFFLKNKLDKPNRKVFVTQYVKVSI